MFPCCRVCYPPTDYVAKLEVLSLSASICNANTSYEVFSRINFEGSECVVTIKVTLLMAIGLKDLEKVCKVAPCYVLEISELSGHPYCADIVIKSPGCSQASSDITTESDESSKAITTVSIDDAILMVVECKRVVSPSLAFVKHSDIIEMMIYCRYIINIKNLECNLLLCCL